MSGVITPIMTQSRPWGSQIVDKKIFHDTEIFPRKGKHVKLIKVSLHKSFRRKSIFSSWLSFHQFPEGCWDWKVNPSNSLPNLLYLLALDIRDSRTNNVIQSCWLAFLGTNLAGKQAKPPQTSKSLKTHRYLWWLCLQFRKSLFLKQLCRLLKE